jgi:hypothetical protein
MTPPPPTSSPALSFVFKRWCRQLHASAKDLRYRITVRLWRLPTHVCNLAAAAHILGPGCANLVVESEADTGNNLSSMTIKCLCIHPDLIPREKVIFVPEPVHVHSPPLFLDPAEIIYHSRPTLCYRILIDILEVEDSHSSSDDGHDDGGEVGGGPSRSASSDPGLGLFVITSLMSPVETGTQVA